nr:MAG TPA: hypothetical protein [Caudoviricetes sp.]
MSVSTSVYVIIEAEMSYFGVRSYPYAFKRRTF